jgi:hypothetical protein
MSRRIGLLLAGMLGLSAACALATRATRTPRLRVTSAMPDLARWEDAARHAERSRRAASFRRMVLERHPRVYGAVFRVPDDSALGRYLDWLAPRVAAAHRIADHVQRVLPSSARRMAVLFPVLADAPREVFIGPSLGHTNGTVRVLDGRPVTLVGVDVQTIVSDAEIDARAVVEHELVHVAHAATNPAVYAEVEAGLRGRPTPIYLSLFVEGLAVWASGRADPTLGPAQLFLDPALEGKADAACARLLPILRRELESTEPARHADWFFLGGRDPDIPRRFAYVAGARLVEVMSARHPPHELLRLDARRILAEVRAAMTDSTAMCGRVARRVGTRAEAPQ